MPAPLGATSGRRWSIPSLVDHLGASRRATGARPTAPGPVPGEAYERARPERSTLHQVVRKNRRTLYAAAEEGFAGAALPSFVRRELDWRCRNDCRHVRIPLRHGAGLFAARFDAASLDGDVAGWTITTV